ncbi:hypothetical protein BGZ76_010064 [Entomortierella beljakovae]|nr:hypothetical protein BGZ76_010064 [Entomortierella beljakovae]
MGITSEPRSSEPRSSEPRSSEPHSEVATPSDQHVSKITVAAAASSSNGHLGDPNHIYTVAARSLHDCAQLLKFLKSAIAQEEKEEKEKNSSHATLGNGNSSTTNGHTNGNHCSIQHDGHHHISSNDSGSPRIITPCKRSEIYTKPSALACQGTVGKHVRHLHDHYRILLSNYPLSKGFSPDHEWLVDYDLRSREVPMETDIDLAIKELEYIQFLLENHQSQPQHILPSSLSQTVTLQATIDPSYPTVSYHSTFGRELWFCSLHAVHHFAMIKVICSEFGLPVSEGFGVAPSTLKHRKQ